MELRFCLPNTGRRKDWAEVDYMASVEDGALASGTGEMRTTQQGWNKSNNVEQEYLCKLGLLICWGDY